MDIKEVKKKYLSTFDIYCYYKILDYLFLVRILCTVFCCLDTGGFRCVATDSSHL